MTTYCAAVRLGVLYIAQSEPGLFELKIGTPDTPGLRNIRTNCFGVKSPYGTDGRTDGRATHVTVLMTTDALSTYINSCIPQLPHQTSGIYTPPPFFNHTADAPTDYQNSLRRPRFPMLCSCRLELSEHCYFVL